MFNPIARLFNLQPAQVEFVIEPEPQLEPEPVQPARDFLMPYDTVLLRSDDYGQPFVVDPSNPTEFVGSIDYIGKSPYVVEQLQGIVRAYVVALDGSWAVWALPEQLELYNENEKTVA